MRVEILALMAAAIALATAPASARTQTFYNPKMQGMRIDRCLMWARDCDEPAASVFCRSRGYKRAVAWHWEYTSPTLVQGDGRVCRGKRCGGFARIACQ